MNWLIAAGIVAAYFLGYHVGKTDGFLAGMKKANEILNGP